MKMGRFTTPFLFSHDDVDPAKKKYIVHFLNTEYTHYSYRVKLHLLRLQKNLWYFISSSVFTSLFLLVGEQSEMSVM